MLRCILFSILALLFLTACKGPANPPADESDTPITTYYVGKDLDQFLVQISPKSCVKCDLGNANLTGSDLINSNLIQADLSGANLSGADLTEAVLYDANLAGAILTGVMYADFTGALNVPYEYQ